MILEKKQNLPKQKTNINKDNLIVIKPNVIPADIEIDDDGNPIIKLNNEKKLRKSKNMIKEKKLKNENNNIISA